MQQGRSIPGFSPFPKKQFAAAAATLAATVAAAVIPPPAAGRELQGRLGIGYNSEFANGAVPSLSLKYALARDLGTELVLGVNTATPTSTVGAFKLSKGLFFETNLNLSAFAGAGMVAVNGNSGFEGLAGFALEFFIPGLESVGFTSDMGVSLGNGSGSFALRTLGVSFLNAGIHFYF
jgi:hypothetical protein